jgi:surface antigen
LLVLATIAALALPVIRPGGARAAGDDYPYKTAQTCSTGCVIDPWGFSERECVSFVAWRLNQAFGTPQLSGGGYGFTNNMNGGNWGNGEHWDDNATALGFLVDSTPRVGSIAHWNSNETTTITGGSFTAGSLGHVGYVSEVASDGTVTVEQYNASSPANSYGTLSGVRAGRYIHVADQLRAYQPVTPLRILDTRSGVGGSTGAVGQTKIDLAVTGAGGVPSSGVKAVVLNLAETGGTAALDSWVTVWPAGGTQPGTANLNYAPGQTTSNTVIVEVGAANKVSLAVGRGTAHLVADVQGWFPTASTYTPVPPTRILDTRGSTGGSPGAVGQTAIELKVTNVGGVPNNGVGAVVLNLAETSNTNTLDSWVTAWPTGSANPGTANLNYAPGKTVSNLVIAQVGNGGKVSLAVARGTAHLIVDVQGWLPTGTSFNAFNPVRILDTRSGVGGFTGAVGQTKIDVTVTGVAGVPTSGVGAVVLNLAETSNNNTADSWVTAWPAGLATPVAANLNYAPAQTASNLVIVQVGSGGKISLVVGRNTTQLILDIQGWFPSG